MAETSQDKLVLLNIRIAPEVLTKLSDLAKREDRSLSYFVRKVLTAYAKRQK